MVNICCKNNLFIFGGVPSALVTLRILPKLMEPSKKKKMSKVQGFESFDGQKQGDYFTMQII